MVLSTESVLEGLGEAVVVAGGGGGRGGGTAGVGGGKIVEKSPGVGGSGSEANCSAAFFIRSNSLIELSVLVLFSFVFVNSPSELFSLNLVEVALFPKGEYLSDF